MKMSATTLSADGAEEARQRGNALYKAKRLNDGTLSVPLAHSPELISFPQSPGPILACCRACTRKRRSTIKSFGHPF